MYNIFDIHVHIYPDAIAEKACETLGQFYNFKTQCAGTYDDFILQATDMNLKGFLTFSVAMNPKNVESINNKTVQLVTNATDRGFQAIGYMAIHHDFPGIKTEVERCIGMGLRGVKIHPDFQRIDIDSPKLMELYESIEGRIPIIVHLGDERPEFRYSEPIKLMNVLDKFPNLEVIATHMGGYRNWDQAEKHLFGRPNVWYDASSFFWAVNPDEAVKIIRAAGTDRVLYGTDYPVMPLTSYLDLFMKCNLTEQEREDILYNNAKRFFGL